jgi:hypothetical protein
MSKNSCQLAWSCQFRSFSMRVARVGISSVDFIRIKLRASGWLPDYDSLPLKSILSANEISR